MTLQPLRTLLHPDETEVPFGETLRAARIEPLTVIANAEPHFVAVDGRATGRREGGIDRRPRLGGLLNYYERAA